MGFVSKIKGIKIETKKGSITEVDVEAIVNPANSYMVMGGGVAAAIRRAGGDIIQQEAMAKAPVPIGKAVSTTAGKLKARRVIHAPTMVAPGPTGEEEVYLATKGALECAEREGIKSLAFPGMGTGIGGIPPVKAARAMLKAIREKAKAGTRLKRAVLVDTSEAMVRSFEEAIREFEA